VGRSSTTTSYAGGLVITPNKNKNKNSDSGDVLDTSFFLGVSACVCSCNNWNYRFFERLTNLKWNSF